MNSEVPVAESVSHIGCTRNCSFVTPFATVPERHEAIAVLGVEEHAERLSAGRQLIAAIGT
jgi:hypothetical protein